MGLPDPVEKTIPVDMEPEFYDDPLLVPVGLKDGRMVTVDEVEQGLACGCSCIECGGRLVARRGEVRAPHFAHHTAAGCLADRRSTACAIISLTLNEAGWLLLPPSPHNASGSPERCGVRVVDPGRASPEKPPSFLVVTLENGRSIEVVPHIQSRDCQSVRKVRLESGKLPVLVIGCAPLLAPGGLARRRELVVETTEAKSWARHWEDEARRIAQEAEASLRKMVAAIGRPEPVKREPGGEPPAWSKLPIRTPLTRLPAPLAVTASPQPLPHAWQTGYYTCVDCGDRVAAADAPQLRPIDRSCVCRPCQRIRRLGKNG